MTTYRIRGRNYRDLIRQHHRATGMWAPLTLFAIIIVAVIIR
jgi:hypothetical protein